MIKRVIKVAKEKQFVEYKEFLIENKKQVDMAMNEFEKHSKLFDEKVKKILLML